MAIMVIMLRTTSRIIANITRSTTWTIRTTPNITWKRETSGPGGTNTSTSSTTSRDSGINQNGKPRDGKKKWTLSVLLITATVRDRVNRIKFWRLSYYVWYEYLKSPLWYTFWQFFGKRFLDAIILDLIYGAYIAESQKKSRNHDLPKCVPEGRFEIWDLEIRIWLTNAHVA